MDTSDFHKTYETRILPEVPFLIEEHRKIKMAGLKPLTAGAIVTGGLFVGVPYALPASGDGLSFVQNVILDAGIVLTSVFGFGLMAKHRNRLKHTMLETVFKAVEQDFGKLLYIPEPTLEDAGLAAFFKAGLIPDFHLSNARDALAGRTQDHTFSSVAIDLRQALPRGRTRRLFRGIALTIRRPEKLGIKGEIRLTPRKNPLLQGEIPKRHKQAGLSEVYVSNNQDFAALYKVFATDQTASEQILTYELMEQFLNLTRAHEGKALNMALKDEYLLVLIPDKAPYLSPPPLGSFLKRKDTGVEPTVQRLYRQVTLPHRAIAALNGQTVEKLL